MVGSHQYQDVASGMNFEVPGCSCLGLFGLIGHYPGSSTKSYFGKMQPDRVTDFCKRNKLQLIIRAHECVMDGFERFAHGQLITLFSATNYCGNFIYLVML